MAFAATRMLRSYAIRDHTHIAFNRHHPWASGLVGLPLTQTARADLIACYNETLSQLSALPADAAYAESTIAITQERLAAVEGGAADEAVAGLYDCESLDELLQEAENEMELVAKMAAWAPWVGAKAPVIVNSTPKMPMPNAAFGGWQTESEADFMKVDNAPNGSGAQGVYAHSGSEADLKRATGRGEELGGTKYTEMEDKKETL